jgi:GT2 family glycosyltransferase
MSAHPTVSAIIVNWNGAAHLRICLPSLLAQSYQSLEIIVVDNASSDDSLDVARQFGVRALPLDHNTGLAWALNRGAAAATGDFFLFVNNDMRFDEHFVAALIDPLLHDEQIFATDGAQYDWDGRILGHAVSRLTRNRQQHHTAIEIVPGLYFYELPEAEIVPAFTASSASMLARRSHFEKLRGFDERLPFGYEDVEICWRAWLSGCKVVCVPNAICWHRVGASYRSGEGLSVHSAGVLKGRLALATKLLPSRYALRTWLTAFAGLARDLALMRGRSAGTRSKILAQYAARIPAFLRQKAALYASAGTTPEKHLDFLLQMAGEEGRGVPSRGAAAPSARDRSAAIRSND